MSIPKCYMDMSFEEQQAKIAKLNVIDDVFFQKMVEDNIVCRDILQDIVRKAHSFRGGMDSTFIL